ncbi:hypothetical protein CRG98_017022 [Punica granatum]|uniref:Uncharacterized protein n=1 Tax=Punica granatum TaxID=22663 RepID=A0A2I0K384_PUNGR|nr:hypothetical protein CRG98_017022 [Punica granatum]
MEQECIFTNIQFRPDGFPPYIVQPLYDALICADYNRNDLKAESQDLSTDNRGNRRSLHMCVNMLFGLTYARRRGRRVAAGPRRQPYWADGGVGVGMAPPPLPFLV